MTKTLIEVFNEAGLLDEAEDLINILDGALLEDPAETTKSQLQSLAEAASRLQEFVYEEEV